MKGLTGKKIAILVENGFEKADVETCRKALDKAGAKTYIVSPQMGRARSWFKNDWDSNFKVDMNITHAEPDFYEGVLVPGGLLHADKLRTDSTAIRFLDHFLENDKPVAVSGHGAALLLEAKLPKGTRISAATSLQTDFQNAGMAWENKGLISDHKILSSNGHNIALFADELTRFMGTEK